MAAMNSEDNYSLKTKRIRGSNFTASEIATLVDEYRKVRRGIEGPRVPNSLKNDLWTGIAKKVSEVGRANRTVKDVKVKWANLSRKSKAEHQEFKRSTMQTGGGPPIQSPQGFIRDIIDLNSENAGFNGIDGGLETDFGCEYNTSDEVTNPVQNVDKGIDMEDPLMPSSDDSDGQIDFGTTRSITSANGLQVVHPPDVNIQISKEVQSVKIPVTKRKRVTQEMLWEAQLEFFQEQTLTEKRRRQLMDVKEEFYKAATSALKEGNAQGSLFPDLFQGLKES